MKGQQKSLPIKAHYRTVPTEGKEVKSFYLVAGKTKLISNWKTAGLANEIFFSEAAKLSDLTNTLLRRMTHASLDLVHQRSAQTITNKSLFSQIRI